MVRSTLLHIVILFVFNSLSLAAIGVSIDSYHLEIPACKTQNFHLTLSNTGDESARAKIYLADFRKDLKGNKRYLAPGSTSHSLANWLELKSLSMVELEPEEIRKIEFSIVVPEDGEGSRWISIIVENAPEFSQKEGRVSVFTIARYVIDVYETIPGTEIKKGKVTDISVGLTRGEFPLRTSLVFENTGNCLLKTKAWMEIRDLAQGNVVAKKMMRGLSLLPGEKREMSSNFDNDILKGDYLLLGVVDYGADDLVAGQTMFKLQE